MILLQVTVGLVYFMSVTHEGMGSIEFLPGGRYLRALFDVHVVKVKINNGMIHGRYGKDLTIDGQKVWKFIYQPVGDDRSSKCIEIKTRQNFQDNLDLKIPFHSHKEKVCDRMSLCQYLAVLYCSQ